MKFLPTSRRMFLGGAGAALALPLLPSLLPRNARAELSTSPVRYIQMLNPYSPTADLFFGGHVTDQRPEPNVNLKSLVGIGGDVSAIVGPAFTPYLSRLSLLRGLDVMVENINHQWCYATCASGYAYGLDNDEAPPLSGQESVDSIMAKSSKVYGDEVPEVRRVVNMNPIEADDYSSNRSFSWRATSEGLEIVRPVKQTQGVLDPFAMGFAQAEEGPDPREQQLMQAVWEDYRRVRDGTRISTADRQRLEAYMALVADIGEGSITTICEDPGQADEASIDDVFDNQFRILAAAMACGMTRIGSVTLGMSDGVATRHEEHHAIFGQTESAIIEDFKQNGRRVARLLEILDGIIEPDGTLLDNSIVYLSWQYGCSLIDNGHSPVDMPVLVAGGAGGRLAQGNFIDYRLEGGGGGLALNNLLVTFLNCMGLSSSDYELEPGAGYGYYGDFSNRPSPEFWSSTEGRRTPLPVLYQGPAMG